MVFVARRFSWLFLVFAISIGTATAGTQATSNPDGPATLALKTLVAGNAEVEHLLVASIEQARRANPDRLTNPAQSLEQYYEFITWAERAVPGNLLTNMPADATLYRRIDQSLGYLYFICDQPLAELAGRGYFNNSLQYVEPYASWMRQFVRSWGQFLSTPASWNDEYLHMAQADATFGISRGWYEDPAKWHTFNQFFARRLKSADQRPIASPGDESVVVSPVDAIPQGVWAIDSNSRLLTRPGVPVKSGTVQSVGQLIGDSSAYKHAFAGGTFTHLFLDVGDYHHYHFPLGGVVKEITITPGREVAGGFISWDAANKRYAFDPSSVGWQSLETRGCLILETKEYGLVALLPIGMSPVSSVSFESALGVGTRVRKGDMLGHFLFGGSDFVIVFQAGYKVALDSPKSDSDQSYQHLLMGGRLGVLSHMPPVSPGTR